MKVLVTGGAGYMGSHVCVALAQVGYQPVIADNFSGASAQVVSRLGSIMDRPPILEHGDVSRTAWVHEVLQQHEPCCVIHLAHNAGSLKTVADRLHYLGNNLTMLASVLRAMEMSGLYMLQVASSAEVYEAQGLECLMEHSPRLPQSSTGHAHLMIENLLEGVRETNPAWRIAVLRHFHPSGAHASGLIGPLPLRGNPGLLDRMTWASMGALASLEVFSQHPATPDGTAVYDYTHVMDAARAHVAALDTLLDYDEGFTVNVGTGRGISVLQLVSAFERINRRLVPWQPLKGPAVEAAHRVADPALAHHLMGWQPRHSLEDICADTLRWHRNNPHGNETIAG